MGCLAWVSQRLGRASATRPPAEVLQRISDLLGFTDAQRKSLGMLGGECAPLLSPSASAGPFLDDLGGSDSGTGVVQVWPADSI